MDNYNYVIEKQTHDILVTQTHKHFVKKQSNSLIISITLIAATLIALAMTQRASSGLSLMSTHLIIGGVGFSLLFTNHLLTHHFTRKLSNKIKENFEEFLLIQQRNLILLGHDNVITKNDDGVWECGGAAWDAQFPKGSQPLIALVKSNFTDIQTRNTWNSHSIHKQNNTKFIVNTLLTLGILLSFILNTTPLSRGLLTGIGLSAFVAIPFIDGLWIAKKNGPRLFQDTCFNHEKIREQMLIQAALRNAITWNPELPIPSLDP